MPLPNRGMNELLTGGTTWTTDNIDLLMVDDTHVYSADNNFVSDVSADEISTTNYARQDIASPTVTEDDTNDQVTFDAADVTISALGPASAGPTIGGAYWFRNSGADATSPLIYYADLTDTQVNGSDFTIQWDATDGVFYADSP